MTIYKFDEFEPVIGEGSYIAESAEVIGNVVIGKNCYVGPKAVIRGDYGRVEIGDNTAIEEGVIIHARPGEVCRIGNFVTLGHGAIIHNSVMIGDYSVIGMGAVVSDYTELGEWSVVAEGSVVKIKTKVESGTLVVGVPAKPKMKISDEYKELWLKYKKIYCDLANSYTKRLVKIK